MGDRPHLHPHDAEPTRIAHGRRVLYAVGGALILAAHVLLVTVGLHGVGFRRLAQRRRAEAGIGRPQ